MPYINNKRWRIRLHITLNLTPKHIGPATPSLSSHTLLSHSPLIFALTVSSHPLLAHPHPHSPSPRTLTLTITSHTHHLLSHSPSSSPLTLALTLYSHTLFSHSPSQFAGGFADSSVAVWRSDGKDFSVKLHVITT